MSKTKRNEYTESFEARKYRIAFKKRKQEERLVIN